MLNRGIYRPSRSYHILTDGTKMNVRGKEVRNFNLAFNKKKLTVENLRFGIYI